MKVIGTKSAEKGSDPFSEYLTPFARRLLGGLFSGPDLPWLGL